MSLPKLVEDVKAANELKRDRLLDLPEVLIRTSLGKSTAYALMAKGLFPMGIRIGSRSVRWSEQSVDNWIHEQVASAPRHTVGSK